MSAQDNLHPKQFGAFHANHADWTKSVLAFGRTRAGEPVKRNDSDESDVQSLVHTGGMSQVSDTRPDSLGELLDFVPAIRRKHGYN
jgi:hypothetical protein